MGSRFTKLRDNYFSRDDMKALGNGFCSRTEISKRYRSNIVSALKHFRMAMKCFMLNYVYCVFYYNSDGCWDGVVGALSSSSSSSSFDYARFNSRQGQVIILISKTPEWLWVRPSLLFSRYRGSFPEVKRPGREVNSSPPSAVEVKNEWRYIVLVEVQK
jgi:hypothetical protein